MQKLDNTLINDKYAANFNPARFELVKHLYMQANKPEHIQNKILSEKAKASIQQYQADLNASRKKAKVILKRISLTSSDSAEFAQSLFEQCKFKQLEQLSARLHISQKSDKAFYKLAQLSAQTQTSVTPKEELSSTQKLESLMFSQEQQVRSQVGVAPLVGGDNSNTQFELKSLKATRESMRYLNVDKSIKRAIEDFPENAGPYNPHMLAITSLMNMRDLSPQYMRRFAGYIETVLWLEKIEVKLKRKK